MKYLINMTLIHERIQNTNESAWHFSNGGSAGMLATLFMVVLSNVSRAVRQP